MIDRDFIASLSCPFCRSRIVPRLARPNAGDRIEHGTVTCSCYEYPIVDGILVLRQLSGPADTVDQAIVRLHEGDVDGARAHLAATASMVPSTAVTSSDTTPRLRHPLAMVRRLVGRRGAGDGKHREIETNGRPLRAALDHARPGAFADYLFQRYANPSFAASIPMMSLIELVEAPQAARRESVVLDLACGIGHSTAMIRTLFPALTLVAADPDFVNLQLLRRHFVADAVCVCLDAEAPLPFADDQLDAVFCLDAFHYIRGKWALGRELDRVVRDQGVWILPHLHNAAVPNISPGIPLRPADYLRMLDFTDPVLLDESSVLEQFMTDHVLDLTRPSSASDLAGVANLTMYATRRKDAARRFDVGELMLRASQAAALGPNPIYDVETDSDSLRLVARWPSGDLARECAAMHPYLPEAVEIDRSLLDRLGRRGPHEEHDLAQVAPLIESLVLIALPPGYQDRPFGSAHRSA